MATKKAKAKQRAQSEASRLTSEELTRQAGGKPSSLWQQPGGGKTGQRRAGTKPLIVVVEPPVRRATTEHHFEIWLWNGRVLRILPGFTDDELLRVLRVAERP
jgi:hypothetical protein